MSVYTTFKNQELKKFLANYALGDLITYKGISGGITNTNYFVDTTLGRYVLTIFEQLQAHELPFYLNLTLFLNRRQVACPAPVPRLDGTLFGIFKDKPSTLITCLNGAEVEHPNINQCVNVGAMLAKMHLASMDFVEQMLNPRYQVWWNSAAIQLQTHLSSEESDLLNNEIEFLNQNMTENLPHGIIHADLFKDNVLMDHDEVSGFIDFYYACSGVFVYDLAITINDWARHHKLHQINQIQENALLAGYESIRKLSDAEKEYLPIAKRAATVRFWVSRLLDFHFPATGEMTFVKDPKVFQNLLLFYHQSTN